jgi:YesN/AraC family two-component response regulator
MTVPAFCRYFKKQSGKTFTQFVNEYRIIYACRQLKESSKMITTIAEESGYKNFSYFNKQFQKFTGKTPSMFRQEVKELVK